MIEGFDLPTTMVNYKYLALLSKFQQMEINDYMPHYDDIHTRAHIVYVSNSEGYVFIFFQFRHFLCTASRDRDNKFSRHLVGWLLFYIERV